MSVTIKTVVFDIYGTLYDLQSVAKITEDAFRATRDHPNLAHQVARIYWYAARRDSLHLIQPWDTCRAKAFGLNVAWIERRHAHGRWLGPVSKATSSSPDHVQGASHQMDELGILADHHSRPVRIA